MQSIGAEGVHPGLVQGMMRCGCIEHLQGVYYDMWMRQLETSNAEEGKVTVVDD